MRIAICFSGHLRNFYLNQINQLWNSVEALQSQGNIVDYFFSIWDTYNSRSYTYNSRLPDYQKFNGLISTEELKRLNPKEIEIENFETIKHKFYLKDLHPTISAESANIISPDGILYSTPMYYKIYKVNLLKSKYEQECNFKYDVVVRYRSNIDLATPLDFKHTIPDTLYSHGHGNPASRGLGYTHESLMTEDMFFYGDSNTMNIVCDLYPNLSKVIYNHGSTGPERLLYDWCFLENKINHVTCPIKFTYTQI